MILDTLENAHQYEQLNKGFSKAFEFLSRSDLIKLDSKKYEIDGNRVFAIIANEQGRQKDEAMLETHEKYIDIQFVLSGSDSMGWKPKASCKQALTEYNVEKDIQFFTDKPDTFVSVESGVYAIFFPEDAHLPLISDNMIHKVVVKIAV